MKKLLFGSIAVLGSGLTFAQSSVTLFGVMDTAVEITKADGAVSLTRVISGGNASSRLDSKAVKTWVADFLLRSGWRPASSSTPALVS